MSKESTQTNSSPDDSYIKHVCSQLSQETDFLLNLTKRKKQGINMYYSFVDKLMCANCSSQTRIAFFAEVDRLNININYLDQYGFNLHSRALVDLPQDHALHNEISKHKTINLLLNNNTTEPIYFAARSGNPVAAIKILAQMTKEFEREGVTLRLNQPAKNGALPLPIAIEKNYLQIVKILLNNGADPNIISPISTVKPIITAVEFGNFEIVKLLIERGANKTSKAKFGATLLMLACQKGHKHIVEFILNDNEFEFASNLDVVSKEAMENAKRVDAFSGKVLSKNDSQNRPCNFISDPLGSAYCCGYRDIALTVLRHHRFATSPNYIAEVKKLAIYSSMRGDIEMIQEIKHIFPAIDLNTVTYHSESNAEIQLPALAMIFGYTNLVKLLIGENGTRSKQVISAANFLAKNSEESIAEESIASESIAEESIASESIASESIASEPEIDWGNIIAEFENQEKQYTINKLKTRQTSTTPQIDQTLVIEINSVHKTLKIADCIPLCNASRQYIFIGDQVPQDDKQLFSEVIANPKIVSPQGKCGIVQDKQYGQSVVKLKNSAIDKRLIGKACHIIDAQDKSLIGATILYFNDKAIDHKKIDNIRNKKDVAQNLKNPAHVSSLSDQKQHSKK